MKPKTVAGLGELLWDVYPDARYAGGATSNVAVHANRLGLRGIIASAVGRDEPGDALIRWMASEKLETGWIQRIPHLKTGTVGVTLDASGVPSFRCSVNVAFDGLVWDERLESLAGTCDAVVVGSLAQRDPVSRKTIQRFIHKVPALRIYDVNFREGTDLEGILKPTLQHTDILKCNLEESNRIKEDLGWSGKSNIGFWEWLLDAFGLEIVAISLGPEGCFMMTKTEKVRSPGFVVDVRDTTGSGDAFLAGVIHRTLNGASLAETAEFANCMGAFTASRMGATPSYTMKDIEQFRTAHTKRTSLDLK